MADYSDKLQSAYDKIAAKGGKITFKQVTASNEAPADPNAPWEGNANDPADVDYIGVLLPLGKQVLNATSNHRILIPALGLPFVPTVEQRFTDDNGVVYALTAVTRLAPDPAQVIMFDCECAAWPGI